MTTETKQTDTADALLREALRALNCAPRFNYGQRARGWKARYAKPDSYQLAARIERYFAAGNVRPFLTVCPECSADGSAADSAMLAVDAAGNPAPFPSCKCGAVLQCYPAGSRAQDGAK